MVGGNASPAVGAGSRFTGAASAKYTHGQCRNFDDNSRSRDGSEDKDCGVALARVERALLPAALVVLQGSGQECPLHTHVMGALDSGISLCCSCRPAFIEFCCGNL